MVIDGKVYDCTKWVPNHPGGNLIMNGAGRDATPLFMSYHPTIVQSILPKYYIGEVEDYNPFYNWNGEFYRTLKLRVENVQKTMNLNTNSKEMFLKTFLLFVLWGITYYYTLITGSFILAFVLGIFHGEFGIQIGHDGNHGSYSKTKWIANWAGKMMDIMGASAISWNMQHNVGHHPNSNRKGDYYNEDYDPDSKSGYPIIRITPNHEWKPHHRYQHIYVWILFFFVGIKWLYGDFRSLYYKKYQTFEFWKTDTKFMIYALSMKLSFFCYAYFIHIYLNGFLHGTGMFILFLASQSYVFILMFGVNHLTGDALFPNDDFKERDWAKLQVLTSCNFATKSRIWLWLSGGLNYQIEHHLFPSINHMYLPYIAPTVKQTCEEFNVPYHTFPDYYSALVAYCGHMKSLGNPVIHSKDQ